MLRATDLTSVHNRTFMCFTLARNSNPEGLVDLETCWTVRHIEWRTLKTANVCRFKHYLVKVLQPDGVKKSRGGDRSVANS